MPFSGKEPLSGRREDGGLSPRWGMPYAGYGKSFTVSAFRRNIVSRRTLARGSSTGLP